MADSVGGTPLEAAARAICSGADDGRPCETCQERARAALTAAIDALTDDEDKETWRGPFGYYITPTSLRRALGLEGDQG